MTFLLDIIMILGVGVVAGVINTMAGGGSLLTLPVLIFLGLPAAVANGTNLIAILLQSFTATFNFSRKGFINKKLYPWLAIPAVIGSIIGADLAIKITDRTFHIVLAFIMVFAVIFVIWNPTKNRINLEESFMIKRKVIGATTFLFIGGYGGFIQAGSGFFIIAALTELFGFSLVQSNAYKNAIVGLYILFALAVFIYHGEVNWLYGSLLAVGNMTGAWIGSQIAITKGDKWVKVFLGVAVVVMAVKLIFFL